MIDVILKSAIVLVGVPVVGQVATHDAGIWSDPRTWLGAAVLIVLTQGDKILTVVRERWARRSLTQEQIEAKQIERSMTETERLQAKVDELVQAAMADRDAEIARLRTELLKAQVAREEYRDMALGMGQGGGEAREARRRLASREMYRTHPGAKAVDEETLEEWSGVEEDS